LGCEKSGPVASWSDLDGRFASATALKCDILSPLRAELHWVTQTHPQVASKIAVAKVWQNMVYILLSEMHQTHHCWWTMEHAHAVHHIKINRHDCTTIWRRTCTLQTLASKHANLYS
jgi:hypothetical protein